MSNDDEVITIRNMIMWKRVGVILGLLLFAGITWVIFQSDVLIVDGSLLFIAVMIYCGISWRSIGNRSQTVKGDFGAQEER